jgi:hypothetical protein
MSGPLPALTRALAGAMLAFAALDAFAQIETLAEPDEVSVATPADKARNALSAERAAQTQALDAAERACYARFFTTNCLLGVARNRRAMQADIKRKEAALDAADRQQRAQDARLRLQDKLEQQADRLNEIDPVALEQAQREKRAELEGKQREHAAKAAMASASAASAATGGTTPQANPPKMPKVATGPSAEERAANQVAFDKKQAEAQRRLTERELERAKAAASGASAPPLLPLPPPAPAK